MTTESVLQNVAAGEDNGPQLDTCKVTVTDGDCNSQQDNNNNMTCTRTYKEWIKDTWAILNWLHLLCV